MTASLRIVPLAPHHRPRWEILYAGYAEFYRVTQTPEMRERVWSWTQDPAAMARERGWSVVRWITADDNYRGRGVYDRVAKRTMWITYDRTP